MLIDLSFPELTAIILRLNEYLFLSDTKLVGVSLDAYNKLNDALQMFEDFHAQERQLKKGLLVK